MSSITSKTEVFGVSPEDLKNIILDDLKDELARLINSFKPEKKEDEYLTRKEVSKILKVSLTTISDWSKNNIIKPRRIGNLIRFKRSDIDKALIEINKEQ